MNNIIYMESTVAMMLYHQELANPERAQDIITNSIMKETSKEPKVRYFILNHLSEPR